MWPTDSHTQTRQGLAIMLVLVPPGLTIFPQSKFPMTGLETVLNS